MASHSKNAPRNRYPEKNHVYEAPSHFVGLFYFGLALWSVVCVLFLMSIFKGLDSIPRFGVFMLAFILFYMWYFSLAFSYRIEVWNDGRIRLTSIRKIFDEHTDNITVIEGPHLPFGFVRFRLEREKGYLFSNINDPDLKKVLRVIRTADPDITLKNLEL
jgi:hypothetical protein